MREGPRKKERVEAFILHAVAAMRRVGARVTQPRLAVLACLAAADGALTAAEVLAALDESEEQRAVDLGTIYRVLEALYELNLVHRIGLRGAFLACSHLEDAEMHVIAYCNLCEKTEELSLPADVLRCITDFAQTACHFQVTEHVLQINGTCAICVKLGRV